MAISATAATLVGSGISAGSGLVGGLVNGPRKQYKYNKKLLEDQYRLQEQAAEANQKRSYDAYDRSFAIESAYNSPAAQRARLQAAGMNVNSSAASMSNEISGSTQGAGQNVGNYQGHAIDFAAPTSATSAAMTSLADGLRQARLIDSQINKNDAEAENTNRNALVQESQTQLNKALSDLANIQGLSESTKNDILKIQKDFDERTLEDRINLTSAQYYKTLGDICNAFAKLDHQLTENKIFRAYGEKQAKANLQQALSAVTLNYCMSKEFLSRVGLNEAQAQLAYETISNLNKTGHLLDFDLQFKEERTVAEIDAIRANSASTRKRTENDTQRVKMEFEKIKSEIMRNTAASGAETAKTVGSVLSTIGTIMLLCL